MLNLELCVICFPYLSTTRYMMTWNPDIFSCIFPLCTKPCTISIRIEASGAKAKFWRGTSFQKLKAPIYYWLISILLVLLSDILRHFWHSETFLSSKRFHSRYWKGIVNKCQLWCENRCRWQSGAAWRKKKKKNLIPQLGNEPGTSRLSFKCSTYWATGESVIFPPNN